MKNSTHSVRKLLLLFSVLSFSSAALSQSTKYSEKFQSRYEDKNVISASSSIEQWQKKKDKVENSFSFNINDSAIRSLPCGSDVLGIYNFESSNQGWDTSDSNASRENYSSRAYSGNYSIRLREDGQAISPSYSLSDYDKLDLKFYFYVYGMESDETFYIDYRDNNSASWQTVAPYKRTTGGSLNKDGDYVNNTFHSKTATLFKDDFSFPASATAQFRLRNDANGSSDY